MIVAACQCGETYTRATWAGLKHVGEMADLIETLELRNCSCRSTIAAVLDSTGKPAPARAGDYPWLAASEKG